MYLVSRLVVQHMLAQGGGTVIELTSAGSLRAKPGASTPGWQAVYSGGQPPLQSDPARRPGAAGAGSGGSRPGARTALTPVVCAQGPRPTRCAAGPRMPRAGPAATGPSVHGRLLLCQLGLCSVLRGATQGACAAQISKLAVNRLTEFIHADHGAQVPPGGPAELLCIQRAAADQPPMQGIRAFALHPGGPACHPLASASASRSPSWPQFWSQPGTAPAPLPTACTEFCALLVAGGRVLAGQRTPGAQALTSRARAQERCPRRWRGTCRPTCTPY